MTSDIDAFTSLAEIALNVPQEDEPASDIDEVRKLAVRALADATAHRGDADKARALFEAAMEKHHELVALADRMAGAGARGAALPPVICTCTLQMLSLIHI